MICTIVNTADKNRITTHPVEKEDKLREIIEHSANVFYSRTTDHTFTYISPRIRQIIGYSPEEGAAKWTDLTSSNPINKVGYQIADMAIETGRIQRPYELELIIKRWRIGQS